VRVSETAKAEKTRKSVKAAAAAKPGDPLFAALRALRKRLADEAGMPPYIVFNDASLWDMVHRQPTTLEEFSTIVGVGQAKLERYGEEFVQVISEFSAAATP
jgi:ATP-dependent DNA helicase RecQ